MSQGPLKLSALPGFVWCDDYTADTALLSKSYEIIPPKTSSFGCQWEERDLLSSH